MIQSNVPTWIQKKMTVGNLLNINSEFNLVVYNSLSNHSAGNVTQYHCKKGKYRNVL